MLVTPLLLVRFMMPRLLVLAAALAALAALAAGCVEPHQLAGGIAVDDDPPTVEPAPAPPPPAPRLAITVGGRDLAAVEIAREQWLKLRVLAVASDGTTRTVTDEATLTSADPATVRVLGPGRVAADQSAATATITATLDGYESAALAVAVAPRSCAPVIASVSPAVVAIVVPCTRRVGLAGWRVVWRGPADVGPESEATLEALAGDGWSHEVAGPGAAASGAVGLRDAHGALVDAVAFGTVDGGHPLAEGAPAPAMAAGVAMLSRTDYVDTGDNAADVIAIGGAP